MGSQQPDASASPKGTENRSDKSKLHSHAFLGLSLTSYVTSIKVALLL